MEIASLIVGYIGLLADIIGFQCKKHANLLIAQMAANFFVALSFVLLGISKMAGGLICFIAMVQALVNYLYQKRERKPPMWTLLLFGTLYAGATALTIYLAGEFDALQTFPFFCALIYMLAIFTVNPTVCRGLFLVNATLWILYDLMGAAFAWANFSTHALEAISIIVGIVRYDLPWRRKRGA